MEIRILEERTNPLLKRHELRFEVAHATAATPTRDSVRTELAKAVHAPKDRVVVERMVPRFGTAVTRGEANVYDSADAAKSITRSHILVRNGLKEKEAKGPVPAAAAPAPGEAAKPEAPAAPPAPAAEPAAPAAPAAPPKHAEAKAAPAEPAAPSKEGAKGEAAAETPKKPRAHAKKE
jgi:small subunit ribosomal protein S24e